MLSLGTSAAASKILTWTIAKAITRSLNVIARREIAAEEVNGVEVVEALLKRLKLRVRRLLRCHQNLQES